MKDEVKGYQIETCFGSGECPNCIMDISGIADNIEKNLSSENIKEFLQEKVNGPLRFHHEFRVSISGCPNACSRPQIVDIGIIGLGSPKITNKECTLCGECKKVCKEDAISFISGLPDIDEARCLLCAQCIRVCPTGTIGKGPKGFKILIGGKLGRHPRLAMEIPGVFNPQETLEKVKRLIMFYKEKSLNGERFGKLLEKNGLFDMNQGKKVLNSLLYS